MKLSEYAARNGINYRAGWNRYKAGKIEGAYLDDCGHVVVPDPQHAVFGAAAVYARVASGKRGDDVDRQAQRMPRFANAAGSVVAVIKEVGSGVNATRPKVDGVVEGGLVGHVGGRAQGPVVAGRVRVVRRAVGVTGPPSCGCQRRAGGHGGDLMDDLVSVMDSFAARLYGLRSARSRTDEVLTALDIDPKLAAARV